MKIRILHEEIIWPILIGVFAFYFITGGGEILNPSYLDWLMSGDAAQHWLGWVFFRNTPLLQWPLGANFPNGMGMGGSIVFSDSIPLLAFFFKLFNFFLPYKFQYMGLWILSCFILQAYFSSKIMAFFTKNKYLIFFSTLFFVFAPPCLYRIGGHDALVAQWVLLAGFYLYLSKPYSSYRWLVLLGVTALIHAYLFLMLAAIWAADLIQRLWLKELIFKQALCSIFFISTLIIFIMWATGYFMLGSGVNTDGFGFYRMNLLSLVNPTADWSHVLPVQKERPGDDEGFNYLGLGMIGLFSLAFCLFFSFKNRMIDKKILPLCVLSIFLLLFALSNSVGFGSHKILSYHWPRVLHPLSTSFRVSGRFFWPVYYLIYIAIFCVIFETFTPKKSLVICIFALSIQLLDASDAYRALQIRVGHTKPWVSPLQSLVWENLGDRYKNLIVVLPANNISDWLPLSQFAAMHYMNINAGYFARVNNQQIYEEDKRLASLIKHNKYESTSLYVFQDDKLWHLALRQLSVSDCAGIIDGFRVLAPKFKNCHGFDKRSSKYVPKHDNN